MFNLKVASTFKTIKQLLCETAIKLLLRTFNFAIDEEIKYIALTCTYLVTSMRVYVHPLWWVFVCVCASVCVRVTACFD